MLLMRVKARDGGKYAPQLLIESVKEIANIDVSSLITDVAINGQAIGLPTQAWGQCLSVAEAMRPIFDVGFDWTKTRIADGIVTGVALNGPAYRAGLRDGMRIKGRTAGTLGDPAIAVTYEVETESGKVEALTWMPAGAARNMQTLISGPDLLPSASQSARTGCSKLFGGG